MSDVTLKYPLWQNHYLQAMAETRPELLKSKINAAEQVVSLRLRQLSKISARLPALSVPHNRLWPLPVD